MFVDYQQIADSALFEQVDVEGLEPFLKRADLQRLSINELLLTPQASNSLLFILVSGQVSVHLEDSESPPITFINRGETIGELSVFDGGSPSAYVKAVCPSVVLCIDRILLCEMMEGFPQLANNLIKLLSWRVRRGNKAVKVSQHLQRESKQDVNIDQLTQLYNRNWLENFYLKFKENQSKSLNLTLAMLLVDIDYFKQFNDNFGHHVGDSALCAIAKGIKTCIRSGDVAARIGGEEFALMFPGAQLAEAQQVAERVRQYIEKMHIYHNDQAFPNLTVSIGIAMMGEGDDFVDLFSSADAALYRAKSTGRNRICVTQQDTKSQAEKVFVGT